MKARHSKLCRAFFIIFIETKCALVMQKVFFYDNGGRMTNRCCLCSLY